MTEKKGEEKNEKEILSTITFPTKVNIIVMNDFIDLNLMSYF